MSTHKKIDKICCVVLAVTLILTVIFVNAEKLGVTISSTAMEYESKLFDTSKVHTINIIMDDWEDFTANCESEEYYSCTVEIDGETYDNVAIRGKGNTSLNQVNNGRYSYKIEFDHYNSATTYYGLDKLCLNNIIQDNTYMKDYLCYQMMNEIGVASPLCSYTYITVNGEDWGLYLAVEAVEESFLQRNYGNDYGELYKPDSSTMGGGRGNGENFNMDDFENGAEAGGTTGDNSSGSSGGTTGAAGTAGNTSGSAGSMGGNSGGMTQANGEAQSEQSGMGGAAGGAPSDAGGMGVAAGNSNGNTSPDAGGGNGGGTQGSDDVLLKYIDDNTDSYSNIFDNAKTDITSADKKRLIKALKNLSSGTNLNSTVDIEAVIRYFVVHNFVLNFDSYTGSMIHNYYLYENDGQLQMIPWDYNLAFGGFQSMGGATTLANYPIDSPVSGGDTSDRPMIAWIFNSEEYTELYHQYFEEFISSYFDSGYFEEMIDEVSSMIAPYVEKDPTKFCTYEEFETGISTLKEFCLLRAESISGQLDGTIGSTSDTQDSTSLIDASGLEISDMGSMNNSAGGGAGEANAQLSQNESGDAAGGTGDANAQMPQANNGGSTTGGTGDANAQMPQANNGGSTTGGTGDANAQMPQANNGDTTGGADGQMPQNGGGADGQMPQNEGGGAANSQTQNSISSSTLIGLGASIVVLALGIVFALRFKRRK